MAHHEPTKSVEEKLAIVLEGLKESTNVSELCRQHGITQTTFYNWRDKFFEGGKNALAANGATGRNASDADKAKIAELERVIGQQAVEIQVFKKKTETALTDDELIQTLAKEGIPVSETCRILHLSRASFYRRQEALRVVVPEAAPTVDPQDAPLLDKIRKLAGEHPLWGYRRITAYLRRRQGLRVNRKRVRRLMRNANLSVPVKRYKAKRTETRSKPKATRPNQWWGTDMTKFYVEGIGWLYLVAVLDWYTKRILAHSLKLRSKAQEWLDVLQEAVATACPRGSRAYDIHLMSDNGSQPTSTKYEKATVALGIEHVTTSYNNPKGNADTERFMRTFKEEVVWPNEFSSFEEALAAVEEFFRFYNEEYPHSTLAGMSPIEFEALLNLTNEEDQTAEVAAA